MSNKAEAAAVFAVMDRNGDGSLDPVELSCRLSDFGVPDEHIERLFYRASHFVPPCICHTAY